MKHALVPAICVIFLVLLCQNSAACAEAVQYALLLCLTRAIPALFPFFAVSALCVSCGLAQLLGRLLAPMLRRVFHLPECGAAALILGFLGGYPAGARTVTDLWRGGLCTREQANALLFCCNNTGPAFLIGMCGGGLFGSLRAGLFLYCVHICAALLAARLLRPKHVPPAGKYEMTDIPPFFSSLIRAVTDAGRSCLLVSSFILFFSVIVCLLRQTQLLQTAAAALAACTAPLGLTQSGAYSVLVGCLELTQGLAGLTSVSGSVTARLVSASFLCAFGGLSVLFQTAAVTEGLSVRHAVLGKCVHAALAAALCALLCMVFPVYF